MSARPSPTARSISTSRRARTTSTASRRSPSPGRATNTCGEGEFAGTRRRARPVPAADPRRDQGQADQHHRGADNFIKGPLIGWNAPKAMVSSMGALTMPQLVISAAIGGGGGTDVLKPSGDHRRRQPVVSPEECERAAEELLGEKPPRQARLPAVEASRQGSTLELRSDSPVRRLRVRLRALEDESDFDELSDSEPPTSDFEPPSLDRPCVDALLRVVGRVEARALEVDRDGCEDALDRLAADLADHDRIVGHRLEDLERVAVRGSGTRRSASRRASMADEG